MTEKPTKKEMYTEIGLSHDRGPSRDTGKATIVARRAKRVKKSPAIRPSLFELKEQNAVVVCKINYSSLPNPRLLLYKCKIYPFPLLLGALQGQKRMLHAQK